MQDLTLALTVIMIMGIGYFSHKLIGKRIGYNFTKTLKFGFILITPIGLISYLYDALIHQNYGSGNNAIIYLQLCLFFTFVLIFVKIINITLEALGNDEDYRYRQMITLYYVTITFLTIYQTSKLLKEIFFSM